jgi:hypothetical protein
MAEKVSIAERRPAGTKIALNLQDTLLVLCACIKMSPEKQQVVKNIIKEGVDWNALLEKAGRHRIISLVAHHLMSPELSGLVPNDVLKSLQGIYYKNLARNMILQDELAHIISEFNDRKIPVIILKGAALLDSVYQDIGLRSMGDLDILVHPEHLDSAEAIALNRGYSYFVNQEIQEQTRQECRHLANLWHVQKMILLEIHHHIVSPGEPAYFDLEGFWKRARKIKISGVETLSFAPEDIVIHLCLNFLFDRKYHSLKALGQLSDISEIIKYYQNSLDWDLIVNVGQEHGFTSALHLAFYACQQLLDTPISPDIMARFCPVAFDPDLANSFLKRRVLDTRPWLIHGLADSSPDHRKLGLIYAVYDRFSNIIGNIMKNREHRWALALSWAAYLFSEIGKAIIQPSKLKEDLRHDRLLHKLYKEA